MATASRRSKRRDRQTGRVVVRRLLIATCVLLTTCLLLLVAGYGYLRWRLGQIERVEFEDPNSLEQVESGEPINFLMVGSDTRENLTGAEAQRAGKGEVIGQRSDTIMILRADPQRERAAILSIPRDLWVSIAGTDTRSKVNYAFEVGGPEGLVQTVTNNLGIPINHYIEVDFVAFRNLVETVGGVPFYFPTPARDPYSDLNIPTAGCVVLDGNQSLALVRSRHYQALENGRYRELSGDDRDRILRQQDFIRRLIKRSKDKGLTNPIRLNQMIGDVVKNVKADRDLSVSDVQTLARRFSTLAPDELDMLTIPTEVYNVAGASALRSKMPEAQAVIDQFMGEASPSAKVVPETVRVRTLNGTSRGGAASALDSELQAFGFLSVGFGDASTHSVERTTIRYGRGQIEQARFLQSYVAGGAQLESAPDLTINLELIIGGDFKGVTDPDEASEVTTTSLSPTEIEAKVYGSTTTSRADGSASAESDTDASAGSEAPASTNADNGEKC